MKSFFSARDGDVVYTRAVAVFWCFKLDVNEFIIWFQDVDVEHSLRHYHS